MGRPQEFDTSEALRAAMKLFWRQGYDASSMADLLEATGLSKSSLYATFGGKRELFLAALDAYREEQFREFRAVVAAGKGRDALETYFRRIVSRDREPEYAFGCLAVCQLVELAPRDADVRTRVLGDVEHGIDAFAEVIARGQADGSIRNRRAPRELAKLFSIAFPGLQALVRAGADRAMLDDAVTVLLSNLD
jgi:TetR/AcrR family transcriptional repressor of nem operon